MNLPETKNPLVNGKIVKTDCPIKEYLDSKGTPEEPILSRSDLCEIALCPSKWRKGSAEEDKPSRSMEFGSLVDCLLLQPDHFEDYYFMAPEKYTNSKKQEADWTWKSSTCRDWREEQAAKGFLVCTQDDLLDAVDAIKTLREHPEVGEQTKRLLDNSEHQVFVVAEYHDPETGMVVFVKCLTDIVPFYKDPDFGKSLLDLKTARSARSAAWSRVVFDQNYHVQAAINLDCHNSVPGAIRWDFRHLIVENVKPWEPGRECLQTEWIDEGRKLYAGALAIYCQCVKRNQWPTYGPEVGQLIVSGGYRITRIDERFVGKQPPTPEFAEKPEPANSPYIDAYARPVDGPPVDTTP
jgi:hypothetical protein